MELTETVEIEERSSENVRPSDLFIRLVEEIGPYGTEHSTASVVEEITGRQLEQDEVGNYFLIVEGGNEGIVFAAHLDTVSTRREKPVVFVEKRKKGEGHEYFLVTDGTTILGADDRAGCAVLAWMILKNVPGTYYFFIGEEKGCIGSRAAASQGLLSDKKAIIEFDRMGYDSVITHQMGERCASNAFAEALAHELRNRGLHHFKPDDTGVYTDSECFSHLVPECTNVSVGYFHQHTNYEEQSLTFLDTLAEALVTIPWSELPIERDPGVSDFKSFREDEYIYSSRHRRRKYDADPLSLFGIAEQLDEDPTLLHALPPSLAEKVEEAIYQIALEAPGELVEVLAEEGILQYILERYFDDY